MEEISSGESDLTARITVKGHDELNLLSTRFNMLMEKLQTMFRSEKNTVSSLTANSEELVANEIRTLAENSAVQSKSIKEVVENIENSIHEIATASANSTKSFDDLEHSIHSMDASIQSVKGKIVQQTLESDKIKEMMDLIEDSSKAISQSSAQLKSKNSTLEEQIVDSYKTE